jgi:hypothetical protein
LEKLRQQPAGRSRAEVLNLLTSYGFDCWEGGNYTICRHEGRKDLRLSIPRQRRVKPYIVRSAVELVDKLLEMEAQHG